MALRKKPFSFFKVTRTLQVRSKDDNTWMDAVHNLYTDISKNFDWVSHVKPLNDIIG